MRVLFLLLLLSATAFSAEITYFMNLSLETTCPDNVLHITAMASNGQPVADVEIRLVLYVPFQGLRALKHTDEQGMTSVELTKPGEYRVYMQTEDYNHPQYVEFSYPEMCPPPPPKSFNLSIEPDCSSSLLKVAVTEEGTPLEDVFLTTGEWSSLTQAIGKVSFPLKEGLVLVSANKSGYSYQEMLLDINCTPPECLEDKDCAFDQYCWNRQCLNLTDDCGYAANHTWFIYECCSDSDCDADFECLNNTCVPRPFPQPPVNMTNVTEENILVNETAPPEAAEQEEICGAVILPLLLLFFRK